MFPQPEIQSREFRVTLEERYGAYWRDIACHRQLGYQKRGSSAFWVARYRTKAHSYRQKRIGIADDHQSADGMAILTFEQAVAHARRWYDTPKQRARAAPEWKIESSRTLFYCPIGQTFTIGHAIYDFVGWKRLVSTPGHLATTLTLINRHIVPRLASLPVKELTAEVIRKFIQEILETPAARGKLKVPSHVAIETLDDESLRKRRKTVNTLLAYIRTSLRMAWENEKIDDDRIWRRIGKFRRVDRPRMLHLSRAECRRLLAVCRPDFQLNILGALYTGCRVTELCRMRCSDVGRDGYGVYVPPTKTHRARFVFLPDEGMAWFLKLVRGRGPDERVFVPRSGKYWRPSNHRRLFKEAVEAADLPKGFSFHGLRHTYASQLVQAGATVFAISEQLGHSNPMTVLRTYGHLSPQIRESEVRQRFTTLDSVNARNARKQARRLKQWRSSLHGANWRTYAKITGIRPRTVDDGRESRKASEKPNVRDFGPAGYLF